MDLNARLRQHTGLTPTDQCIRDYFLRHPEKAARMNSRQLADATFTSPSAVARFCRKFGYQGLQDFKNDYFGKLPDAPAFDLPDGDFPFDAQSDTETLVCNILKLEEGTLRRLRATLDLAAFERAAGMLLNAKEIDVCAAGTGLYLMNEFSFRLMKFGFRVNDASNSVNLSYIANRMDETHCLVLVSYSGQNDQIGRSIHFARKRHTPIVLITAQGNGPAAHLADCILTIPLVESCDDKISTFASAAAEKALLDLLLAKLFQANYDKNCAFVHEDAARLKERRGASFAAALKSSEDNN